MGGIETNAMNQCLLSSCCLWIGLRMQILMVIQNPIKARHRVGLLSVGQQHGYQKIPNLYCTHLYVVSYV